jgi:hypothetical protein
MRRTSASGPLVRAAFVALLVLLILAAAPAARGALMGTPEVVTQGLEYGAGLQAGIRPAL